ncbi:hypothetical protein PHISP_07009 [Aspergillus sp. HF37]|nr:hypothetical protein PHISP_07009 [Aspergillus sp. HF37]
MAEPLSEATATGIDQDGKYVLVDPTADTIGSESTSAESTPKWSATLPSHTRSAPGVSERSEQEAPLFDPALDEKEDTRPENMAAESECPPTADPSAEHDNDKEIHHSLPEGTAESDRSAIPVTTEELVAKFDKQMDRLEIAFALTKAVLYLDREQDVEAENHALQSLDIAKRFGEEAAIARSIYWLGRIEYYRHNDAKAHRHFLDARPCIGVYDEGQDVLVFLSLFQRGITEEQRERILRAHTGKLPAKGVKPESGSRRVPVHAKSRNKKHEDRPSSVTDKPKRRRKRKSGKSDDVDQVMRISHNGKREKAKPRPWLVPNNIDIYPHAGDGRRHRPDPDCVDPKWDMMWLIAAKASSFRPQQSPFTFTMYPKGLAPRHRMTDIFDEQCWEWIMPRDEWEDVREAWAGKSTTMLFLATERQELKRTAMQKRR